MFGSRHAAPTARPALPTGYRQEPPPSDKDQKTALKEVPDIVVDEKTKKRYEKGTFLGKGGFARCYELTDMETGKTMAGKIISKTQLVKSSQREKIVQEIEIQRNLSHPHVVRLFGSFEDEDNVYVLLELCPRRSLMELHKRRKAVTEPEARFFIAHIVQGTRFIHDNHVIHRDMKLGNLFLSDEMHVKIGDFGLATKLMHDGERRKTLCGTPNYIAPEVLNKVGHSYEVDVWAIGCILYTLLVGRPPFQTKSLKDTYQRIRACQYVIPTGVSDSARELIQVLLHPEPHKRPLVKDIFKYDFFVKGTMPRGLPTSCLTMTPKINNQVSLPQSQLHNPDRQQPTWGTGSPHAYRQPQRAVSTAQIASRVAIPASGGNVGGRPPLTARQPRPLDPLPENNLVGRNLQKYPSAHENAGDEVYLGPPETHLQDLFAQLSKLFDCQMTFRNFRPPGSEETEDPAATPVYWVSKWVDYSDKYGIGYQLSDNSVGVCFNDNSKIVCDAAGCQVMYTSADNLESYFTLEKWDPQYHKKMSLLKYFRTYMMEHLLRTGEGQPQPGDELSRLPCLYRWFRTRSAIVLHLSNGTLQLNFFDDHSKVIVCPLMNAVTYVVDKKFRTFRLDLLTQYGMPKELHSRLTYVRTMISRLLSQSENARPGSLTTSRTRSVSTAALV